MLDTDAYTQYIEQMTPIYQGTENRILFIDSSDLCPGMPTLTLPTHSTSYNVSSTATTPGGGAAATRGSTTLLVTGLTLVLTVMMGITTPTWGDS